MQEDAQIKQWDRLLQLAPNHLKLNITLGKSSTGYPGCGRKCQRRPFPCRLCVSITCHQRPAATAPDQPNNAQRAPVGEGVGFFWFGFLFANNTSEVQISN